VLLSSDHQQPGVCFHSLQSIYRAK
jgi:hypothetical protein